MEKLQENFEVEQDKLRAWSGLDRVGPGKSVGYLPIETIRGYIGKDLDEVATYLKDKGLEVRIFTDFGWPGLDGSLYVYDKMALQKLLDENKQVLIDAGWPTDADGFVANLKVNAKIGTPIFKLIAKAFDDKASESLELDE